MQLILISIVFGVACAWEIKPISSIGERPTGLWPRGGAVELNKLKPEEIKGPVAFPKSGGPPPRGGFGGPGGPPPRGGIGVPIGPPPYGEFGGPGGFGGPEHEAEMEKKLESVIERVMERALQSFFERVQKIEEEHKDEQDKHLQEVIERVIQNEREREQGGKRVKELEHIRQGGIEHKFRSEIEETQHI